MRIQAQASRLHAYQGIGLFVWHPETGAFLQHDIEGAPSYDKVPDGDYNPPTAVLDEQAAQVLANSLWDAGIRPEGARASVGQLAATQAHLEDMRAMAFQGLKVQKPGGGK